MMDEKDQLARSIKEAHFANATIEMVPLVKAFWNTYSLLCGEGFSKQEAIQLLQARGCFLFETPQLPGNK